MAKLPMECYCDWEKRATYWKTRL